MYISFNDVKPKFSTFWISGQEHFLAIKLEWCTNCCLLFNVQAAAVRHFWGLVLPNKHHVTSHHDTKDCAEFANGTEGCCATYNVVNQDCDLDRVAQPSSICELHNNRIDMFVLEICRV